jgi:hypothetical protein
MDRPRSRSLAGEEQKVGLYERIIVERAEEERRRGRPLGMFHNSDSPVLDRLLAEATEDRPRYRADLVLLRCYLRKGPTNAGMGMRLRALRQKYQREYVKFKADTLGQGELL